MGEYLDSDKKQQHEQINKAKQAENEKMKKRIDKDINK